MNKAIIAVLLATVLLAANASASIHNIEVDVNGGYDSPTATYADELEDTVQCVPDDGNFTVTVSDANATSALVIYIDGVPMGPGMGAADGNVSPWSGDTNGTFGTGSWDDNIMTSNGGDGTSAATINVRAPKTEGLHRLCVVEDGNNPGKNGPAYNDDANHCEWVSVKPDSQYTSVESIKTTDDNGFCNQTDYSAMPVGVILKSGNEYIELEMQDAIDLSADTDFDSGFTFQQNKLKVENVSGLEDTKVKVTFKKPSVQSSNWDVRRNDSACSICSNQQSNEGEISFTTTKFSTYEIVDAPTGVGFAYAPPTAGAAAASSFMAAVMSGNPTAIVLLVIGIVVVIIAIKIAIK